jgi:hypothetical protein
MTFVLKLQGLEAPAETDSIAAPSNVLSTSLHGTHLCI